MELCYDLVNIFMRNINKTTNNKFISDRPEKLEEREMLPEDRSGSNSVSVKSWTGLSEEAGATRVV